MGRMTRLLIVDDEPQIVRALTPREYQLLRILAGHAGQVVTHKQIIMSVWGADSNADAQFVRVLMAQLRQKLETDPASPTMLLTEPGIGYRLYCEDEA